MRPSLPRAIPKRTGTSKQPAPDEWDRRAAGLRAGQDDDLLVELCRRYLEARKDQALGLAPARLLPPRKAHAWILFWTAARRVDDAVESGARDVEEWRERLGQDRAASLAERALQAFLRRPEGAGTRAGLMELVQRGLHGLDREPYFDRPRPLRSYLDLIHDKSATAMLVLDHLLFSGESDAVLRRHAEAFAASTQMGDDCRDTKRDLAAGRCFVTLEELAGEDSLRTFVKTDRYVEGRRAMCLFLLEKADQAVARFQVVGHRATGRRLSDLWLHALRSDQVRPTQRPLSLPTKRSEAPVKSPSLPRSIRAALESRF